MWKAISYLRYINNFPPYFLGFKMLYGVGSDSGSGAVKWFWYEVVVGEND